MNAVTACIVDHHLSISSSLTRLIASASSFRYAAQIQDTPVGTHYFLGLLIRGNLMLGSKSSKAERTLMKVLTLYSQQAL